MWWQGKTQNTQSMKSHQLFTSASASLPSQEAINLLEPMTNDPVNYVRQGALIASALIMIQQTEVTCPKVCA